MIRLLALFLLIVGPGCAMMDNYEEDVYYHDSPAPRAVAQPACGTGVVPATFNQPQTQEPPR